MLGFVPVLLVYLISANFIRLSEEQTKETIGSLYLGMRTDSRLSAFQVVVFLVVRLGFAIISFRLRTQPGLLVESYIVLNLSNIVYLGLVRPHESRNQQVSELFNASMIELIAYLMLVLVNLMQGPESEFTLGWVLIGVIGLIFLANLGLILVLNLCALYRRAKLFYLRYKQRKRQ